MKESDYVKIGNLTKFQIVETILNDVIVGFDYGIRENQYRDLISQITDITEQLFTEVKKILPY